MLPAAAEEIFGEQLETITRYVDILASRGIDRGLLGPREADRLWDRHVLNSAALAPLPPHGARVIDVGSGAGLPGVPLAILRRDLDITLLEPMLRRSEFLAEVIDELGLGDHVRVERGRAEAVEGRYDVVTARAVAPLRKLVSLTHKLFLPDGELLAMKGASAGEEVSGAIKELKKWHLTAEVMEVAAAPQVEPTNVVRVRSGRVSRET